MEDSDTSVSVFIGIVLLIAVLLCTNGCTSRQPTYVYYYDGWDMWRGPDGDWLLAEPRLREGGQPYNRPATHRWASTDGTPRGMYLVPVTDEECER